MIRLRWIPVLCVCAIASAPTACGNSAGPNAGDADSGGHVEVINHCAPAAGTCDDFDALPIEKKWTGALVHFAMSVPHVQLAVFDDGVLRRNPPYQYLFRPSDDVVARLSVGTMRNLEDPLKLANAETWFDPFFGEGGSPFNESVIALDVDGPTACLNTYSLDPASGICELPPGLRELHDNLVALAESSAELWAAAQEGTISLNREFFPEPWPLSAALAEEGRHKITEEQYQTLEHDDALPIFVRSDGAFVWAGRSKATYADGSVDYRVDIEIWPDVTFPDGQDLLREELLENVGRYASSSEQWLGIPLGPDQFPLFKGKKLLTLPGIDQADPVRYYWLIVIEHFDLTEEGEL